MIEMLSDLPDGVTGIRVAGPLTGEDFTAIRPAVAESSPPAARSAGWRSSTTSQGSARARCAETVRLGFGAVLPRLAALEKTAIVTEKGWLVRPLRTFAWMIPGEVAFFGLHEIDRAAKWVVGWTAA